MNNDTSARAERSRRAHELQALGWTYQRIADELQCSRQTVAKDLNPIIREHEREYRRVNAERLKAYDRDRRERNADHIREQRLEYRRANAAQKAEYDRAYRAANADRIREYQIAYKEAWPGLKQEQNRRYRTENAEKISERRRELWAANAEELNARRRATYGDRERERLGRYRRANLEAHRAVHARRKVRASVGMDAIDRLLAVEYRKAITGDPCRYCGAPGEHDDHKLPLARGGTDHFWNLHRTCRECNQRKHLMTHEEFLASREIPGRPSRDHAKSRTDTR